MKRLLSLLISIPFLAFPAVAATYDFDIEITSISGEGSAINLGFYSTASVGDMGTGRADIYDLAPADYAATTEFSSFRASFPGIATATSLSGNPVIHDPTAGTVTVGGFLGGLTGPYTEFLSAGAFEFVYTGIAGGPVISSNSGLNAFMANATMSGFFVGEFYTDGDSSLLTPYQQRIDFKAVVSEVPLPAGAWFLLSAIGMGAWLRWRQA